MFSHVKGMGEIQTEETPKINTFQTMRKEVSGMAVFRIEKTRDYTVMSNHHLRDMSLSLKAKGLLCDSIGRMNPPRSYHPNLSEVCTA